MDRTLCTVCENPHDILNMNEELVCEWCQTDVIADDELSDEWIEELQLQQQQHEELYGE